MGRFTKTAHFFRKIPKTRAGSWMSALSLGIARITPTPTHKAFVKSKLLFTKSFVGGGGGLVGLGTRVRNTDLVFR